MRCGPHPVGLILGNLDKDIADFLKPGLNVLILFFCLAWAPASALATW